MKSFWVADFNSRGDLQLEQEYSYGLLEMIPGCAELLGQLSSNLWRSPEGFETQLRIGGPKLRWAPTAETAGLMTIRTAPSAGDHLVSLSVLATGMNPEADTLTLQAFAGRLLHELRDTGYEPSFAMMDQARRPLVATFNFSPPTESVDQGLAALADRCFAASYFRYHHLA